MFTNKNLRNWCAMTVAGFVMLMPLLSYATSDTTPSTSVDKVVKLRQMQNEQTQLNNIRLNAKAQKQTPAQFQTLERVNLQKRLTTTPAEEAARPKLEKRIQLHRLQGVTIPTNDMTPLSQREVVYGSGMLSLSDSLIYFNFENGTGGTDSTGMDVMISGNEGTNFGNEGWSGYPNFDDPSLLYFYDAAGSLDEVSQVAAIDDPEQIWTTISWDWNGGNNGQPLAVGNLWVVYTRTTNCYVVLEVTDVGPWDTWFTFDYMYQADGTTTFDGTPPDPMVMTVNGDSTATLPIGSNPYLELTMPDPSYGELVIYWDSDHSGTLTEFDIPVDMYEFSDNDIHDEDMTPGVFGFTYTDEMAEGLNAITDTFIFAAFSGGENASVPVSFYQDPTPFEISGTVTLEGTGDPLPGIVVWVSDPFAEDGPPEYIDITNDDGTYSIFVPDTGTYYMGSFDHLMVTGGLLPDPFELEVTVWSTSTVVDFTYRQPSSSISGYVTDEMGTPIPDAGVYVDTDNYDLMVWTDETGYYEAPVDPGEYWIGVDWESVASEFLVPEEDLVMVDEFGATHDISLFRSNSTITGQVTLDGNPLPDVVAFAWNEMVGTGVTITDESGNFTIPVYTPVDNGYYLDMWIDGPMENLVKLSDNFNVMPGATGEVIEYITVNGGITGYLYDSQTEEPITSFAGVMALNMGTGVEYNTGPDWDTGEYTLYLPDGMYQIVAGAEGYLFSMMDTIVISGEMLWYDFYLDPMIFESAVEGYVYNNDTNAPIPGAEVNVGNETWGNSTSTDENGYYHMDVPNGDLWIGATAPGYLPEWDEIYVYNESVQWDFYLSPFEVGGTITGTTYGFSDEGPPSPLPYTDIAIFGMDFSHFLQSDENGYFSVELPEGLYQVEAYHEGYLPAFVDSVWVSGNVSVDLYLEEMSVDGAVFGQVVNAETQEPIVDAEVILFIPESPIGYQTWTDWDGNYWLDVENGDYHLNVYHPDYQPYLNTNVNVNNDTVQVDVALQGFDGAIYGTVYDEEGDSPIQDAWVYIQSRVDSNIAFYLNTNWDGEYYAGVPNGSYDVTAGRWDYDAVTQFNINVNDNEVQVDFTLSYHDWATAPEIMFVQDQPNDQGRWVRMRFTSGGTDWGPYHGFSIWRMTQTPGGQIWDYVNYVAFNDMEAYNVVAPTLVDSNATTGPQGNFWSTFLVTGHADMWSYVDSDPVAGYSIDNIVPGVPQNLAVTSSSPEGVTVEWDANLDDDFQYYQVYRSESSDFTGVTPVLQVESSFVDDDIASGHTYYYMVKAVDANGNVSDASNVVSTMIVSVADAGVIPTEFSLDQNYPNPFNPSTQIRFGLPEASNVTMTIYNIRGQAVRTLVNGYMTAGYRTVTWDGKDNTGNLVSSGTYIYRINASDFTATRKMVLMR
ncbi:MAG: carboxypeptidase regulatory-like domain-containing protein [Candidatus Marinimicrobia bacterium]|nr:carboxypeptidase regulatory-like domain-containing protein [Candidatus Neomarinimicrobiota bacterium]